MNQAADVAIADHWSEDIARKVAAEEHLELTDEHRQIIAFVRK